MIVHLHIPKNAGTTFDKILARCFGTGYVEKYGGRRGPDDFLAEAEMLKFFTRHRRARAVSSHEIRFPCPAALDIPFQYITFIRHPVERIVSLYFFEKRTVARKDSNHRAHLPLENYLNLLIEQDALVNFQCCHLHAQGNLSDVQETLRQVDVVGLVEEYNASLVVASHKLSLPLTNMIIKPHNVGKRFTAQERLTPDLYQRVAQASGADVDLFYYARDRLHADLRRSPTVFDLKARYLLAGQWVLRHQPTWVERLWDRGRNLVGRIVRRVPRLFGLLALCQVIVGGLDSNV